MDTYQSAAELLRALPLEHLERPLAGLRPHAAKRAARWFLDNFPGKCLYAVKANNAPHIVQALYEAGIRDFDVASLPEVLQVAALGGRSHIMHPIKSRRLIAQAYHEHGIRTFALDSQAELEKILAETGNARDLTLVVRMACPSTFSEIPLEGKFGVSWLKATGLLRETRQAAGRFGLTFHVGSQAMSPGAYGQALRAISQHIVQAGVLVDVIDVGGGFPASYPGLEPPPLQAYVAEITHAFEQLSVGYACELWCEPGRALCAEAESLIVCVEARKGDKLYINDGAFGALFDAAHAKFAFPARALRKEEGELAAPQLAPFAPFALYGPTCDSIDHMPGPFLLPESISEGDYIEIGNTGAYGRVIASHFNGFGHYGEVLLADEPMLSMYLPQADAAEGAGLSLG